MKELPQRSLAVLEQELTRERERRERQSPADYFPWHEHQDWLLHEAFDQADKDPRIVLALGGNRGGKSAAGKGLYSEFMRRVSPLAHKLQTVDKMTGELRKKNSRDPVTVWIIPPTLEKARQDWVNPSDGYSIKYWLGDLFIDEKKTPDYVFYSRPPGMSKEEAQKHKDRGDYEVFDKTILKSHDQSILSFEASAVDLAIVDEEIMDEKKWNSLLLRIGTPNGTIVMCFTPLHGLSWSYERYWKPMVKLGAAREVKDRCWIHDQHKGACVVAAQFGAADNPLATEYATEIEHDAGMSQAEKNARLYGEYGYVEGALVPQLSGIDILTPEPEHEPYVVDVLPGQTKDGKYHPGSIEQWFLVADPNKSYGATLAGQDGEGNIYFVAEHLQEAWPDRKHADAFKQMERKYLKPGETIRRIADPGSAGAQSIVNMSEYGLFFETAEKGAGSVSASVKRLRSFCWIDPKHYHPITGKQGAPRLYFYRPGMISIEKDEKSGRSTPTCRLADQISQARQTDNENAPPDTPHKSMRSKLDLFDCARYTVMVARSFQQKSEPPSAKKPTGDFRLPASLPLKKQGDYVSWTQGDFYLPEYQEEEWR